MLNQNFCRLFDANLCKLISPSVCKKHSLTSFEKHTPFKQEIDIYKTASQYGLAPKIISIQDYFAPEIEVTENIVFPKIHQGYTIVTEAWDGNMKEIYKKANSNDKSILRAKSHQVLRKFHQLGFYHLDIKLENFVVQKCDSKWKVALIDFEFSQPRDALDLDQYFKDERAFLSKPADWVLQPSRYISEYEWIEHCNLQGHFRVEDNPRLYPSGFNIKMFSSN